MNNSQNETKKTEDQILNEVLSSIKDVITQNSVAKIDDAKSETNTNGEDNDHVLVLTEVASITHDTPDELQFSDNTLNNSENTKYNDMNDYIEKKEHKDMSNSYKRDTNSNNENYGTAILPIGNKKLIQRHINNLNGDNNLVSETTAIKVESTVQKLKDIIKDDTQETNRHRNKNSSDNKGQTIEEIVTALLEQKLTTWLDTNLSSTVVDLLNPKLSQWLNENIHIMVDKIVREEIQKLLQTSNKNKGPS